MLIVVHFFWLITMKRRLRLLLVIGALFLMGCANNPALLGVSDLEWTSYSPEKQKSLLANYGQISKERKSIIKGQENQNLSDVFLEVSVSDGKIMFPPAFINWQNYKPVKFKIFKGQCSDVEIEHQSDNDSKTKLGACFYDNILYLDHIYYDLAKKNGTVSIHFSPLWLTGFAYKGISSSGYVGLNNVTVEIKQEEKGSA